MGAAPAKNGLTVTLQRLSCLPAFQIARPTGLEPGYGFVGMALTDIKKLTIVANVAGVNAPAPITTLGRTVSNTPAPATPSAGLTSIGDLVITERLGAAINWTTTIKGILITEKGIETIKAIDGGTAFVKVDIADIRYLWSKRGILFDWINIPVLAAGQSQAAPAGGGSPPSSSATAAKPTPIAPQAPDTNVGGTTQAQIPPLIPGSMDGDKPWTLRRTLEVVVLPRLPGSPKLKRLPPDLEKAIPIGHVWDGILPVKALGDLLDEFQLVLALNQDASVSFWHEEEGGIAREDGTPINYVPGNQDEYVSWAKDLVTPHYIPSLVVVLGPPIRDTSRQQLEAVGAIRSATNPRLGEQIVPLNTALASIGVSPDAAAIYATASKGVRALLNLPADAVKQLDRWYCKWFRLPGGIQVHSDWVPIEDRGTVDDVGTFLPPRVWSESFDFISGPALAKLADLLAQDPRGQVSQSLKALINAKASAMYSCVNLPWAEQSTGFEIDRVHGVVKFHSIQAIIKGDTGADGVSALNAFISRPANVQLEWGWDRKPQLSQNVVIAHRYASFWARTPSANGGPPTITAQATLDPNAFPLTIHRIDLLEVHDADGNSNKPQLDSIAKAIATAVLTRPEATTGSTIQLHRPVPVQTNGRVTTVVYSTSSMLPRVMIHVGSFAPLTAPHVDTHARQPRYKSIRDSVIVPKGLG